MNSYRFLAGCYDQLTYDGPLSPPGPTISQKHFRRQPLPGRTVLDLACGTGSLTRELALRGYEMIGVDQSPEMLAEAAGEKPGRRPPLSPSSCASPWRGWTCTAPSTPACVVWTASTMLPTRKSSSGPLSGHLFLMPGGLFLFDVNTVENWRGWMVRSF